jgi:hypothetical protein
MELQAQLGLACDYGAKTGATRANANHCDHWRLALAGQGQVSPASFLGLLLETMNFGMAEQAFLIAG